MPKVSLRYHVGYVGTSLHLEQMQKLLIPTDQGFLINIMLQRTGYLIEQGLGSLISDWTSSGDVSGFSKLAKNPEFVRSFLEYTLKTAKEDARGILNSTIKHGCKNTESIASIGCGNGFVELYLAKLMKPKILYLIDIEETPGKHHHGINIEGAGYSDLSQTKKFLEANLEHPPIIVLINPQKYSLPAIKAQLIISILSAGFHYPINSYSEFIMNSLDSSGILIFDQRFNAGEAFGFSHAYLKQMEPCFVHKNIFSRSLYQRI